MDKIKPIVKSPGRPTAEGKYRKYILPDDVHEWIMKHGGSRYLTNTMRAIIATSEQK